MVVTFHVFFFTRAFSHEQELQLFTTVYNFIAIHDCDTQHYINVLFLLLSVGRRK